MAEARKAERRDMKALLFQIQALADPEIQRYISSLKAKFQRYEMTVEEGRKCIDESMGQASLTDLLYEMRRESV